MKTDNPWKESILAHSIRQGHPFWEHDPERSLKEVIGSIYNRDFEDWESQEVDTLRDDLRQAESDAEELDEKLDALIRACGARNASEAIEKIKKWNPTQTTPSST